MILLRIVDRAWKYHFKRLDESLQGIGLRAYGQKDPLTEYHFEAHNMFQNMIDNIKEDCIKFIFRVKIEQKPQPPITEQKSTSDASVLLAGPKVKVEQKKRMTKDSSTKKKMGRNDPCLCGSGLKYKYCCGKK